MVREHSHIPDVCRRHILPTKQWFASCCLYSKPEVDNSIDTCRQDKERFPRRAVASSTSLRGRRHCCWCTHFCFVTRMHYVSVHKVKVCRTVVEMADATLKNSTRSFRVGSRSSLGGSRCTKPGGVLFVLVAFVFRSTPRWL